MTRKSHDTMGGFAKGLKVLDVFQAGRERLTITDISNATGLDRATARRCLLTLVDEGYANFDGKYFSLTPRILRLAQSYLTTASLPSIVQPHLERLCAAVDESASVAQLDGDEIVYVARAERRRIISVTLNPGSRLPAYCTSFGRTLLSQIPESSAAEILRGSDRNSLTVNTRVDLDEIMAEIHKARQQGYCIVDQELELGLCSIAIPLFSTDGSCKAAMNIGTTAARVPVADMAGRFLPALAEAQKAISLLLN